MTKTEAPYVPPYVRKIPDRPIPAGIEPDQINQYIGDLYAYGVIAVSKLTLLLCLVDAVGKPAEHTKACSASDR